METQSARNAGTYVFVAHGVRIYKNTSISNGNVLCYYIVKIAIQRGKMHMKKTITTLLLLTMLLSQAACGGTKDTDTETTGTDTTTDTTTQGDSETETEQADPLAGLEAVEMECYTFRQLIRNNDDFVADMIAEEQTGEVVNDAVFRRNTEVEERYNFNVFNERSLTMAEKFFGLLGTDSAFLDLDGAYASHFAELSKQKNPDLASWYEKKLSAATTARDKTLAAYRERAGE